MRSATPIPRSTAVLAAVVIASLIHVTAHAQNPVGTNVEFSEVGLVVPQPSGFQRATRFHGFQQDSTGASVLLMLVPGPFKEVSRGFNAKMLATRGMQLEEKTERTVAESPGYLLRVRQNAHGQTYVKWVLVFGDDQRTRMVTASVPTQHAATLGAEMMRVLNGVRPRAIDASAASRLPFTVEPAPGLVEVQKMGSLGKMLAFTKDGRMPVASPSDPFFIVAPSLGAAAIEDRRAFSLQRLRALSNTTIEDVTSVQETTIDGLGGYEILAAGIDQRSGTPLAVYQTTLFQDDGGYVLMVGIVGRAESTQHLLRFQTTAKSYRRMDP